MHEERSHARPFSYKNNSVGQSQVPMQNMSIYLFIHSLPITQILSSAIYQGQILAYSHTICFYVHEPSSLRWQL